MQRDNLYVIAYDIPEDRRRTRLANLLKSYGERVQLSVFECWLSPPELEVLKKRIGEKLDLAEDSVRIYKSYPAVQVLGVGPIPEEKDFYVA